MADESSWRFASDSVKAAIIELYETRGTEAYLADNLVTAKAERDKALAELEADARAITRVRALHVPSGLGNFCRECSGKRIVPYPCPTIRALEGDE